MNRTTASIALVALAAFALAGCTLTGASGAPPEPMPTAAANVALAGEKWSGTGTGETIELAYLVPHDAQTLVLRFGCRGSLDGHVAQFDVQLDPADMSASRSGECDGLHQWELAISPTEEHRLSVWVSAGILYVAEVAFRAEPPLLDPDLEAECGAYASIQSAFFNADMGFRDYGLTEQEWRDRVADATQDLEALAAASKSLLSAPLTATSDAVAQDSIPPGTLTGLAAYQDAHQLIGSICLNNDSPLITMGEFGG